MRWCQRCRLRISLSAAHTTEDVEALAAAIRGCGLAPPGQLTSQQATGLTGQQAEYRREEGDGDCGDAAGAGVTAQQALAGGPGRQAARSRL